jgi:hypothetical protein
MERWYIVKAPDPARPEYDRAYRDHFLAKLESRGRQIIVVTEDKSWDESALDWHVPTDAEARRRPMVEVKNHDREPWRPARLLAVKHMRDSDKIYIAMNDDTSSLYWKYCRIHQLEISACEADK